MVWPDERWMMQLMAGEMRERRGSVVLIVQHIIYCTQSFDSQRNDTNMNQYQHYVCIFAITSTVILNVYVSVFLFVSLANLNHQQVLSPRFKEQDLVFIFRFCLMSQRKIHFAFGMHLWLQSYPNLPKCIDRVVAAFNCHRLKVFVSVFWVQSKVLVENLS